MEEMEREANLGRKRKEKKRRVWTEKEGTDRKGKKAGDMEEKEGKERKEKKNQER